MLNAVIWRNINKRTGWRVVVVAGNGNHNKVLTCAAVAAQRHTWVSEYVTEGSEQGVGVRVCAARVCLLWVSSSFSRANWVLKRFSWHVCLGTSWKGCSRGVGGEAAGVRESHSAVSHRIRLAHLPKHNRKSQQQPQHRPAHLQNLFRSVLDMAKYYLLSTPARPFPPAAHVCGGDKAVRQAGRKRQRVCHLHTDATKGNKIATRAASSGGKEEV